MAAKRQTVDIAAIKQQAEARGREAGQIELAAELLGSVLVHQSLTSLKETMAWVRGVMWALHHKDDGMCQQALESKQLLAAWHRKITEEANQDSSATTAQREREL